jgi:large repetitive protein
MNMNMTNMMKNVKMFNADSIKNAISVHSLQKNVSNNRSMKNTFLTPSLKNWFVGLVLMTIGLFGTNQNVSARTTDGLLTIGARTVSGTAKISFAKSVEDKGVFSFTSSPPPFTCATVDSRNNGNNTGVCAGSGSNPIASNFVSTIYATVPSTTKTGNITFKWNNGTEPTAPPAITKVWINGGLTATEVGPASPYNTATSGITKVTYCFYGVNLPSAGSYTLEFTDPQTGLVLGVCSFSGSNNTTTTTPTLQSSVNAQPTISSPSNITTACGGVSNGPVNITVGDPDGALNTLVISASSSNTSLIPNGNITITQPNVSGAASLVYTSVAGQTGTTTITLTVTDAGGLTATSTFDINVTGNALSAVTATLNQQPCGSTASGSINTTATGGNGTLTYVWTRSSTEFGTYTSFSPAASPAANPTNLSGNFFYKVTVTDACGTVTSNAISISNVATLSLSNVSQTGTIVCNGGNTGAISGTITGGGTPARVLTVTNTTTNQSFSTQTPVSGNSSTGFVYTISNLTAGTYSVVASSTSSSCTATVSNITISQPAAVVPVGTPTAACSGLSNGSISASASGGTAPYTFSINGTTFQSATSFTSLAAGTYTLTAKDVNNCTGTVSVVVSQPSTALSVSVASQTNVNCFGQSTGSVTVSGSGGTGTYSYSNDGTNFQASTTLSSLPAGTYTITIKDQSNCTATTTVTITQPTAALAASTSATNVACNNATTGAIASTVSGGTTPYTYSWNTTPVQTTPNVSGLAAGSYTLTVTDNNGCTVTSSKTITQPSALTATISAQTNVACFGGTTGAATVSASGGTPSYTYSWTGGGTLASISNKAAGAYTVTVTDANNCTTTATATITQPTALAATISASTNILCRGNNTGAATVAVTGGTASYTYSWNTTPVQTTATATTLAAGTYIVTVTDANNCTTTATATITQPAAALAATISSQTNVLCNGASTGAATVTTTGGTVGSGYAYSWNTTPVQTTNTASSLVAGTYTVTVTDANLCTTTAIATITQPTALTGSVASTNACFNTSNGTITITATGGNGALSYSIDNGANYASTASFTGLTAGTYDVKVKDANNCVLSLNTVTILAPNAALAATSIVTNVSCNGLSTGAINLSVTGGAGSNTFAWTGPSSFTATSEDLSARPAGAYNVTVTDAYNCTTTASISITQPSALTIAKTSVNVGCFGQSTGSVNVTVSGGTGAYSYAWTGSSSYSSTSEDLTTLPSGTYNLTVTDANGCTATTSETISQPTAALAIQTSVTNVACFGNSTGAINVTVTGGTAPYSYNWGGGITTEDRSALTAGTYSVTVTDANNCTSNTTVTITQPTAALAVSLALTPATCYQVNDAAIATTVTGGTAPYTYNWGGGVTTANISNAGQHNTYQVVVTDANGCTVQSGGQYVPQVAQLNATTVITQVSCNGGSNGSIAVSNLTGGYGTYAYSWNGTTYTNYTSGTITNSGLSAGSYTLYLRDAANTGCVRQIALTVTQPNALAIANTNTNVSCNGGSNGAINITVSGGASPYTYNWGGGITTEDRTGISAGTYSVVATDANGCTLTSSTYTISQPTAVAVTLSSQTNNTCFGLSTGSATVNGSGGTAPYTYSINGTVFQSSGLFSSLAAGNYTITVKDANNCTSTLAVIITEPNQLVVTNEGVTDASCANLTDGAIAIGVSGGTSAYSFAWTGPNAFTSALEDQNYNLAPGTYAVTVSDANACTATLTNLVVTSPAAVSITLNPTNVSCFGGSNGSISATVTGGTPAYAYQWIKNGTNFQTTPGTITNLTAGTYSLNVSDANFCSFSSSSVTITVPAALSATVAAGSAAICSGQTATFTITGTATQVVTYSINNGSTATATIGGSGTATVTVANATTAQALTLVSVSNGACSNNISGTANVSINALPTANAGSDQVVCNGSNVTLATSGSDTYSWNNSVSNNVAFVASNNTNAVVTTTYTLTATDINGCVSTDQVDVTVNPTPTVNAISNQTLCAGTSTTAVNFASTFNVAGTSYNWTNSSAAIGLAANGTGNIASFTATNNTTSAIVATITVTPIANTCSGTPQTFTITVQPLPTVKSTSKYCLLWWCPTTGNYVHWNNF